MLKNLLIVEDDVGLTELLFDTFVDVFDIIDTVYNVDEACRALETKSFSLIILDINLNNRNGAEIVKFLKDSENNANKDTPVVIVSGLVTPKFLEMYTGRFAGIVSKPFEHSEIRKLIGDILNSRVAAEEVATVDEIPEAKYVGPFVVNELKEQVDQVMIQVKKNTKLKSLFKQVKIDRSADSYILTHTGLIINISAAICIKMDWSSDKTLEKFVYAAYLHDMTLSARADLARIDTFQKLEILKETLSEEDYKLVFEHPNMAAKVVSSFNEVPPDVEIMIRQHHELPNQTGFPNSCGHQKITPLSAVFIVAHNLADFIIEHPKWTMEDFVKKYRSRLHGSHFTKIMRLLSEIK